MNIAITE